MSVRILILGAGGHGQVVADALLRAAETGANVEALGYLDDDAGLAGRRILGLPVLGGVSRWHEVGHDALVVAFGDNRLRRALFERLDEANCIWGRAVHPRCVLAPDVKVGRGVMVSAGAIINTGAQIGDNVILNTGCSVDHHSYVADHAHIAPGAHLGGGVRVGTGSLVGIGAAVLPQIRIGNWCTVGGGAVVNRDVPDGAVVIGNPARPVRRQDTGLEEAISDE